MEPVAITAAIIALPTFLTEIIRLGQGIQRSLNKVIISMFRRGPREMVLEILSMY